MRLSPSYFFSSSLVSAVYTEQITHTREEEKILTFDEHAEEGGEVKESEDDDERAPQNVRVSVVLRRLVINKDRVIRKPAEHYSESHLMRRDSSPTNS